MRRGEKRGEDGRGEEHTRRPNQRGLGDEKLHRLRRGHAHAHAHSIIVVALAVPFLPLLSLPLHFLLSRPPSRPTSRPASSTRRQYAHARHPSLACRGPEDLRAQFRRCERAGVDVVCEVAARGGCLLCPFFGALGPVGEVPPRAVGGGLDAVLFV